MSLNKIARTLFVLIGLGGAIASTALAWQASYHPDGLPLWDSAGYLLEAVRYVEHVQSGDVQALLKAITKPDLHPPLHSAMLASWLLLTGNTLLHARVYALVTFVASLAGIVWLGQRAFPRRGLEVGVAAAALTALSLGNLELIATPMTESSGLLVTVGGLLLASYLFERGGESAKRYLLMGGALLAATLVRFNLGPMIGLSLGLAFVAERWRTPKQLLDPRILLLGLPTVAGLGLWQLARPEVWENIQKFLENRSSGLAFWSVENLLFVPLSLHRDYLGTPLVTVPLLALLAAGLLPPKGTATARIVRAFVLLSFLLLTLHDFKIARNLAIVVPFFLLAALGTLAEQGAQWGARLGAGVRAWLPLGLLLGLGGPFGVWQHQTALASLSTKVDCPPDPQVRQALEFIEQHARGAGRVWVTGWVFRISPNLIEYWLRMKGIEAKIELDQKLFGVTKRTGVESPWSEEYRTQVETVMLAPDRRAETVWITIETTPGGRYADDWKAFGNHYARAMAEQSVVPEIDRVEFLDDGLLLRAYQLNGTPSTATTEALQTGPRPEDDLGLQRPQGPALDRETFHRFKGWQLSPPAARVGAALTREDSALVLSLSEAHPNRQLCGPTRPAPSGPFRAVIQLSTKGLSGKSFLHIRGMDASGALTKKPDGSPDITHVGPLQEGGQLLERDVTLQPGSTGYRVCVIAEGLTGEIRLEDITLVSPETPWIKAPTLAAAPNTPALPPAQGRSVEDFLGASARWALSPPNAAATITQEAGGLRIDVPAPSPKLAVCGAPFAFAASPLHAHLRARTQVQQGKPWLHLRALDAQGVLLPSPPSDLPSDPPSEADTFSIVQIGPLVAPAEDRALDARFPAGVAQVRPCLVLDGVQGSVWLEGMEVTPR